MATITKLAVDITAKADSLHSTLDAAANKVDKFAGKVEKMGSTLSRRLTLPILGLGAGAVKAFSDFDDAMNQSIAIMGDVSDEMRTKMELAAREVAKTTVHSATDAAEGYYFLASAGFTAEQAIAALPQVAAFAQAGMFDLEKATEYATDSLSALGMKSDDANQNLANLTRITDVFTEAANRSNASVEQFAEAMTNKAGAALRLVNKDVEEGVAVLSVFADQGLKGAGAGEALNIVTRDLQRAALDNADAFTAAGIAVYDNTGKMRNYADIVSDMERYFQGMSDAQKRQAIQDLGFQDRSVSNILLLMGMSDKIREYEANLRLAGGTTQEVADKQLESFKSQMLLAKNKVMDAAIVIGDILAPKVVELADKVVGAADAFSQMTPQAQKAILVLFGVLALMGPLMWTTGKAARMVRGLAVAFGMLKTVAVSTGLITVLSSALESLALYALYAGEAIAAAFAGAGIATIGLIAAAVVALVAQIVVLWKYWDEIWNAIVSHPALAVIGGLFAMVFAPITLVIFAVIGVIKHFSEIIDTVPGVIRGVADAVVGFFSGLPGRVQSFFTAVWTTISTFAMQIPTKLKAAGAAIVNAIVSELRALPYQVGFIIGFVAGFIVMTLWNTATGVYNAAVAIVNAIVNAVTALPGIVSGIFWAVYNFITSVLSAAISWVAGAIPQIPGIVAGGLAALPGIAWDAMSSFASAIASGAGAAISYMAGLPGQLLSALGDLGSLLYDSGVQVVQGLIDGIGSMAGAAQEAISNIGSGIKDGFTSALDIFSPSRVFMKLAKYIPIGAAVGINRNAGIAISAVQNMAGSMAGAMGGQYQPAMAGSGTGGVSGYSGSPAPTTNNSNTSKVYKITVNNPRNYKEFMRDMDRDIRLKG